MRSLTLAGWPDLDAETTQMSKGLRTVDTVRITKYRKLTRKNESVNLDMHCNIDASMSQIRAYLSLFEDPDFSADADVLISQSSELGTQLMQWQHRRQQFESVMEVGSVVETDDMIEILDDALDWRSRALGMNRAISRLIHRGEFILQQVHEAIDIDKRFCQMTDAHRMQSIYPLRLQALLLLTLYRTQKAPSGPSGTRMFPRLLRHGQDQLEFRELRVRAAFQTAISQMRTHIREARRVACLKTDALTYCLDNIHRLSISLSQHQETLDELETEANFCNGKQELESHLARVVEVIRVASADILNIKKLTDEMYPCAARCSSFFDLDVGPLPFAPLATLRPSISEHSQPEEYREWLETCEMMELMEDAEIASLPDTQIAFASSRS